MQLTLTRRLAFHARHRMHKPGWSEAESQRRFGWTADPPGHGHLYRVAVSVSGPADVETGAVIDLELLDAVLAREVVLPFSGSDLNATIPAVAEGRVLPTCEAMAAAIWQRVTPHLPAGVTLVRVTVAEDDSLEAECTDPA
jgi:6-pyruvoyltetrahydropterin/6-carboxytetrahydropterin synthase